MFWRSPVDVVTQHSRKIVISVILCHNILRAHIAATECFNFLTGQKREIKPKAHLGTLDRVFLSGVWRSIDLFNNFNVTVQLLQKDFHCCDMSCPTVLFQVSTNKALCCQGLTFLNLV